MSATDNGGPAFPVAEVFDERRGLITQYASDGMTLRDYFAAKAMQTLLAMPPAEFRGHLPGEKVGQLISRKAYSMADFMLKARAQ